MILNFNFIHARYNLRFNNELVDITQHTQDKKIIFEI